MEIEKVKVVVKEIDTIIRKELWYEFIVDQYTATNKLILNGGFSTSYPDIEIIFEDIFFISLPIMWKSDTKKVVLTLLEGEEFRKMNIKFGVEIGYHIFKFTPNYYSSNFGCLIGAKKISFRMLH
ncbi:hypothetical protein [Paenisporosarcina sp.]|uniref:hypothetical protein n=1 Tax=Paenisporosarcina sp. TaxID=1932001 RepID=UPI003C767B8F